LHPPLNYVQTWAWNFELGVSCTYCTWDPICRNSQATPTQPPLLCECMCTLNIRRGRGRRLPDETLFSGQCTRAARKIPTDRQTHKSGCSVRRGIIQLQLARRAGLQWPDYLCVRAPPSAAGGGPSAAAKFMGPQGAIAAGNKSAIDFSSSVE
jgi:hypothetical protein